MSIKRRDFIKLFGANVVLPYLSPLAPWLLPRAYGESLRTNFLAVYFPNGAYMPTDANGYPIDGDWNWTPSGALHQLVTSGLQNNVMVIRKLKNGFSDRDPHWQNVAGFLSGKKIVLDPSNPVVGESIDQIIAREKNTFLKSIQVGASYFHIHELADHPDYSNQYTNRISYDAAGRPLNSISDPQQLYSRLFTVDGRGAEVVDYLRRKKKSILDVSTSELKALSNHLPAEQKPKLEAFEESLRSIERQLDKTPPTCDSTAIDPSGDFHDINASFVERNQLLNKIVCLALQCGITNVVTMMYGPSISSQLNFNSTLGSGLEHHSCAHHGNLQSSIDRLKDINRLYTGLYVHLLNELKNLGLLTNTLTLIGSDMSDGNIHNTRNLPLLLVGAGADLKFGHEIIPTTEQPITNLHLEILKLMGVAGVTSLGEGETQSTGPLGIIKT